MDWGCGSAWSSSIPVRVGLGTLVCLVLRSSCRPKMQLSNVVRYLCTYVPVRYASAEADTAGGWEDQAAGAWPATWSSASDLSMQAEPGQFPLHHVCLWRFTTFGVLHFWENWHFGIV